jgi:hypothetical protein
MPPVSPIQAAAAALVVAIGNAAIAFGAINNTAAATVETAVIGAIALGFVIANALHHSANAKVAASSIASSPPALELKPLLGTVTAAPPVVVNVHPAPGTAAASAGVAPVTTTVP